VLGVGIVGAGAGELIAEGVLAIEMCALAADVGMTIHPHPTLSETMMEAAEVFYGQPPTSIVRKGNRYSGGRACSPSSNPRPGGDARLSTITETSMKKLALFILVVSLSPAD
jgi:hypothetical protein